MAVRARPAQARIPRSRELGRDVQLIRQGWGQENPAFRQMFTSLFIPGGTPEQMQWFNDLQRITTSPDNAIRLRQTVDEIDVSELLPRVKVPTLVLHCRDDAVQPFEEGRRIAAGIPGARFVALEGRNHMLLKSEPVWSRLLDEIEIFSEAERDQNASIPRRIWHYSPLPGYVDARPYRPRTAVLRSVRLLGDEGRALVDRLQRPSQHGLLQRAVRPLRR